MPKRTRLEHIVEYAAIRTLESCSRAVPRPLALALGAALGDTLRSAGVYRRILQTNLRHIGYWDDAAARAWVPTLYRTMGRYVVDFLRARPGSLAFDFPTAPLTHEMYARKSGTIVVLGHYGNWEAMASMFGKMFPELLAVAMPMRNKLVENWLTRKRAATGVVEIDKQRALRPILAGLRRNAFVAVLIDQNARKQGTPAPFMGKTASTVRTVAGVIQHTNCSVLLSRATIQSNGRYLVHVEEGRDLGIDPSDSERYITAYQAEHNEVISRWIRQEPHHWFGWFHRRFDPYAKYS